MSTERTFIAYNVTPNERKAIRTALQVESDAYNSYNAAHRCLSWFPRRWVYVVSSRDYELLMRVQSAFNVARAAAPPVLGPGE